MHLMRTVLVSPFHHKSCFLGTWIERFHHSYKTCGGYAWKQEKIRIDETVKTEGVTMPRYWHLTDERVKIDETAKTHENLTNR